MGMADEFDAVPGEIPVAPVKMADDFDAVPTTGTPTAAQPPRHLNMLQDIGAGAISGASKIGATLLSPVDWTLNKIDPSFRSPAERRAALQQFFTQTADPKSWAFRGGELGGIVAGTAGVGPAIGSGAAALGAPSAVVSALSTGGLSVGGEALPAVTNAALRAGAGAVTGAASAGLVNPSQAAAGGVIGAVTPGAAWLAGLAGRGIFNAASGIVKNALGMSTGVGPTAVQAAYDAGKVGDSTFLENMRGEASMEDIVGQAKDALNQMRIARGAQYREGMAAVSGDKTVLDFAPIQKAVDSIASMGSYKGQVINPKSASAVQELSDQVKSWASLDPAEFHTPEGLDALKKSIGDIRDSTQFGTPARRAADQVYHAIKDQITAQAPTYADTMAGYEAASSQLDEIQRSLSLGNKSASDTALRKLQSVLRNNVNTNFSNRMTSVQALQQQGGASLVPGLAGQSMNTWAPRGMAGAIEGGGAGLATVMGHPSALALAPFASPRLVGEASYKAGQLAGFAAPPMSAAAGNLRPLLANPNVPLQLQNYLSNGVLPVRQP
jgi:hypothetical protein